LKRCFDKQGGLSIFNSARVSFSEVFLFYKNTKNYCHKTNVVESPRCSIESRLPLQGLDIPRPILKRSVLLRKEAQKKLVAATRIYNAKEYTQQSKSDSTCKMKEFKYKTLHSSNNRISTLKL
jgi:hypothetical protein